MKNKIDAVGIEYLTVYGNGQIDVKIIRRPHRRAITKGARGNNAFYANITTASAMRLARTIADYDRNRVFHANSFKESWGTKVIATRRRR